ncbi:MAG TPA: sigma-70 family RNA polymerase sigma factor [Candidatus Dormibacteraeota bacterium]
MSAGVGLDVEPDQGPDAGTAQGPDHERLGIAFLTNREALLSFADRALGDPSLAEEAVQETFVRALRTGSAFDPGRGPIRAWLFAIERHIVTDLARVRQRHPNQELDANAASPEDQVDRAMSAWLVEEALRQLDQEHRQVVVEVYFRGRTSRDLAHRLGIPEGTVRSRLHYALRTLRASLEELRWRD